MNTKHGTRRAGVAVLMLALAAVTQMPRALAQDQEGGFSMGNGPGRGRMVRGTVTAVAPDRLTVKAETGDTFQIDLTPNTRLMKDRDAIKAAEVHVGDGIGAMGELDVPNHTVHALFVTVVDAEQLKKLRNDMGKSYITGKVTAINDLKLTVLRTDGVTQTISVDEGTSFRKGGRMNFGAEGFGAGARPGGQAGGGQAGGGQAGGGQAGGGQSGAQAAPAGGGTGGESITLADIKVGDMVGGQGSLKDGVFVPTQLSVGAPGQGGAGGRRRRQGDGTNAPASSGSTATPPGSGSTTPPGEAMEQK